MTRLSDAEIRPLRDSWMGASLRRGLIADYAPIEGFSSLRRRIDLPKRSVVSLDTTR